MAPPPVGTVREDYVEPNPVGQLAARVGAGALGVAGGIGTFMLRNKVSNAIDNALGFGRPSRHGIIPQPA